MNAKNFSPALTSPLTLFVLGLAFVDANGLFNHELIPSMEPRFAEVITEMIRTGQFLIPIKNGVPYIEYPPLLYWLAIINVKLGLPVAAAIRLPCYISFIAWVLSLDRLQSLLWRHWPARLMPFLGAAMPAILWHFFTAQTDSLLIVGVLISMVGFVQLRLGRNGTRFPWFLWLGIALATSAKGPVGLACTLPVMILEISLATLLAPKSNSSALDFWSQLRQMAWFRGGALVGLTSIPWYVLAGLYHGWDFVSAVAFYQNFERYISGFDHSQPWWYYFVAIATGMLPLSLMVPFGLWFAVRRLGSLPERLIAVWAIFSFLFFTISASKQGKYILPAAPAFLALGIMGVDFIFSQSRDRVLKALKRWALALVALWGLLVVAALPFYSERIAHVGGYAVIREALTGQRGKLIHFGWPRSLTLYELGAPMRYVRSSRELYKEIRNGSISPGDYLLVAEALLPAPGHDDGANLLIPAPATPWFQLVLEVEAEKKMHLYKVMPGAGGLEPPATPEPQAINWRDAQFDTD